MSLSDLSRKNALLMITVVLMAAAFMRMYALASIPHGEAFDSTWNHIDALRISRGYPFLWDFDTRPEPLYRFLLAGWFLLLGPSLYSARVMQAFLGTLTIALTYQAGLAVLRQQPYRRWGALMASATVASIVPHLFLSRAPYRAILLPLLVPLVVILLARAARTQTRRDWAVGGLAAGLSINTYLAGIASPIWMAGFLLHQLVFRRKPRLGVVNALITAIATVVGMFPWIFFALYIPDLLKRAGATASEEPFAQRLTNGFEIALKAFFVEGFNLSVHGSDRDPFVNPLLAGLIVVGFMAVVWHWRKAEGILILGGIIAYCLPAVMSIDPNHPLRLSGTMPMLALLSGWGTNWLLILLRRVQIRPLKGLASLGLTIIIIGSLVNAHHAYQDTFRSPRRYNPPDWPNVPHQFVIGMYDAMLLLQKVDQPTYIPLYFADMPLGAFMLQSYAFPNVTTWARYGLTELPAGEIFYPQLGYYHGSIGTTALQQVLLLPDEDTIVILPSPEDQPAIESPDVAGVQEIYNAYGWLIAKVAPVPARPLPVIEMADLLPTLGEGLHLANAPDEFIPGTRPYKILYWQVSTPQKADIFSFLTYFHLTPDGQFNAQPGSQHRVLPYLYPSVMWQPGDIVPDLHTFEEIPPNLPEGLYRWGAGVYLPPGQDLLPVIDPGVAVPFDDLWLWGAGQMQPPLSTPIPAEAQTSTAQFGEDIQLKAYQINREGATWTIDLYWETSALPEADYILFVHAYQGDQLIAQTDAAANPPTWAWWTETTIHTQHSLTIESEPDALYLGMYSYPSIMRLPVLVDGERQAEDRLLLEDE